MQQVTEGYSWIRSTHARTCCWCCQRRAVKALSTRSASCTMADSRQCRCPVAGCGVWKNVLSKRGGSNRRWYSVASSRHLLTGLLDEALAALPFNDHICPNCYKRIRRPPSLANTMLDELAAAADEQPPSSPPLPPSTPPLPPPSPLPVSPTPSPPLPSPTPPPTQPSALLPSGAARRALSLQFSPRRTWSFKEKEQICTEWSAASTVAEKQAVRTNHRAQQLDGHHVKKWKEQLALNESKAQSICFRRGQSRASHL
jgi:hypothetical protein